MTPEIKEKKGVTIIGLRYFGSNSNNEIPALWHEFLQRTHEIKNMTHPCHFYGVCQSPEPDADGAEGTTEFEYVAGAPVASTDFIPQGMVHREVPDARYAVFTHKGPLSNLQDTYKYIYGEWAPKGEYILAGTLDFEFYNEDFDPGGSENSKLYIYIPIN